MKSEKFRLITCGKLTPQGDKEKISHFLITRRKFSPQAVEKIFSGRPVVLSKSLDWQKAQAVKALFLKLGLITNVRLQFDRTTFASSITTSPQQQVSLKEEHLTIDLPTERVRPALLTFSGDTEISIPTQPQAQEIHSSCQCNPLLFLLVVSVVALGFYGYSLPAGESVTHAISLAQLIPIALGAGAVLIISKLLLPRQSLLLCRQGDETCSLRVKESLALSFSEKHYTFSNQDGIKLGHMVKGRNHAHLNSVDNETVLEIDTLRPMENGAALISGNGKHIANIDPHLTQIELIAPPENQDELNKILAFAWLFSNRFVL